MKKIIYAVAAALALLCLADEPAHAQTITVVMSRTKETLACASPCGVSANNTLVFNDTAGTGTSTTPDKRRTKWACRNVGAADVYLCKGTTCSSTSYDYLLTTAGKDSYTEDTGTVWGGAISAASTGSTLACAGQL